MVFDSPTKPTQNYYLRFQYLQEHLLRNVRKSQTKNQKNQFLFQFFGHPLFKIIFAKGGALDGKPKPHRQN